MSQINNGYYPKDRNFTEISIRFFGDRTKVEDIICYRKLKSISKKLDMTYPKFIIDSNFFSMGTFLRYSCRTILEDSAEKRNKVKAVCSQLIKYGIKNKSIPIIESINYGEKTTIFTLEDYLRSKGLNLEDLNIEEVILDEIGLDDER